MSVIDLPSRAEVMAALTEARLRQRRAEIDQVALIATAADAYGWVDTDPAADPGSPSVLHGEQLLRFGADGTPEVAEFICLEVGPALRMSPDAARALIRDVLNLRHRLPLLWAAVLDDGVEVRTARTIARRTSALDCEPCRWLDAQLAPLVAHRASAWKLIATAEDLTIRADAELAERKRQEALAARRVELAPVISNEGTSTGVTDVFARLDTIDAIQLDGTLDALAECLATDATHQEHVPRDVRRARALGLLADPTAAARLLTGQVRTGAESSKTGAASSDQAPGSPGNAHNANPAPSTICAPTTTVTMVVHLKASDFAGGPHASGGVWERHGPQTRQALQELLGRESTAQVRIQPIIDLNQPIAVTTYRPSERLGLAVRLRDGAEVFPWSSRRAAATLCKDTTGRHQRSDNLDLDHTTAWPIGPTQLDNLGLLSRTTHRAVTHGGYAVEQVRSGVFRWRTPAGQTWWTHAHGTTDHPPPQPGSYFDANPDIDRVATSTSMRVAHLLDADPPDPAIEQTTSHAHHHAWATAATPGGRPRQRPPDQSPDEPPPPF